MSDAPITLPPEMLERARQNYEALTYCFFDKDAAINCIAIALTETRTKSLAEKEAENARLREVVIKCTATFREYAGLHRAKNTPDADEKARRNEELMTMCAMALVGRAEGGEI